MAQHDMNIANADGATFRADANNALAALVSNSSGATEPTTTFAYQWWADMTAGLLKIRNAANSAWITVGTLASAQLGHLTSADIGSTIQAYDARLTTLAGMSASQATYAATNMPTDGTFSFRNKIINGYMRFDQRNSGAALNAVGSGYTNSIDRWQIYSAVAGKFNIQQNAGGVSPPAGFPFYLGATTASAYTPGAGDYNFISQKIEADNISTWYWGQPAAKSVTLSFWVRSSLTGTHSGFIGNSALTTSYPFTFTINSANTWEFKTITIPGSTAGSWNITGNGIGAFVGFCLGNGSSFIAGSANAWTGATPQAPGAQSVIGTAGATFYVAGVQLEEGSTATPFESRPYGVELALCQRYYQRIGGISGNDITIKWYAPSSGYYGTYSVPLPVEMRASPTGAVVGTWGVVNCGQPAIMVSTNKNVSIQSNASGTGACNFYTQNTTTYIDLPAEL